MNHIKILLFLISFEILTCLLLPNLDSMNDDFSKCKDEQNATQCSAIEFETKTFQCCSVKTSTSSENQTQEIESCGQSVNPISQAQKEKETENGKIMFKEYFGNAFFGKFLEQDIISLENEYTCKDGTFNFNVKANDYTEEEIEKYKDNNYCLNLENDILNNLNLTKEMCLIQFYQQLEKIKGLVMDILMLQCI